MTDTPADCSFLFQPSVLLNYFPAIATRQPVADTFIGWSSESTPSRLGFWRQPPDLLRHFPTLDTRQSVPDTVIGWSPTSTPSPLGFWVQPPNLLRNNPGLAINLSHYEHRGEYCLACKYCAVDLNVDYVCIRYPPLVFESHDKIISRQPTLPAADWCGEFDEL